MGISPLLFKEIMTGLINTIKQSVGGAAECVMHPFGWQLGAVVCFGLSPRTSANSNMPNGILTSAILRSDYRQFEHC
jgi:hypothetical protein